MVPSFEKPGEWTLMHHMDPATGRYKGRQVVVLAEEAPQE